MSPRPLLWTGALWLLTACSAPAAGPDVEIPIPMQSVAPADRNAVKSVFEKATLSAKSQPETFKGSPEHYLYFLDNPDRAVCAWRRLGAKCVTIQPRANNQFGYTDEQGSKVTWRAVVRQGDLRVWYAEGKVKGPLLALVPIQAVVVIRHGQVTNADGTKAIVQQTEIYVHTDSAMAAAVMKMMGTSAEHMAEQGLGQFQFFFSGLCQYLQRNPDHLRALVREDP